MYFLFAGLVLAAQPPPTPPNNDDVDFNPVIAMLTRVIRSYILSEMEDRLSAINVQIAEMWANIPQQRKRDESK